MWIFTTLGFVSAVKDNQNPGCVLLRFRHPDHAKAIRDAVMSSPMSDSEWTHGAPDSAIRVTPMADYRWKCTVTRRRWKLFLESFADIDYTNFKDACHAASPDDPTPLTKIWDLMYQVQAARINPEPKKKKPRQRQKLGIVDTRTPEEKHADGDLDPRRVADEAAYWPTPKAAKVECRYCGQGDCICDPPEPHKGVQVSLNAQGGFNTPPPVHAAIDRYAIKGEVESCSRCGLCFNSRTDADAHFSGPMCEMEPL